MHNINDILQNPTVTTRSQIKSTIVNHKSNKIMFKSVIVCTVIASAAAFAPVSRMLRVSPKISMSSEFLPGAVAPFGYFDPLSLSKGKTEGECRKIRESELKHGRVAMVVNDLD
jgi:hypothetical protein